VPLPVLPYNEQSYDDVVKILDHYETTVLEVCEAAGVPEEDISIHIGGDQLTRERFSGAKCLRAHGLSRQDSLNHLSPITCEWFHTEMALMQVFFDVLHSEKTDDNITLYAQQIKRGRTKVSAIVKDAFDDDKAFLTTFVRAYIAEAICEKFEISHDDVNATVPMPTDSGELKTWVKKSFGDLVEDMVMPAEPPAETPTETPTDEPAEQLMLVMVGDQLHLLSVPKTGSSPSPDSPPATDKVHMYARNVLELGLLVLQFSENIKFPNRERMLPLLKVMMMTFKGHKNNSKYALEMLRVICHQLGSLSEKAANEAFYGTFVNTKGKVGSNIPADLQMEYLVKRVKTLMKRGGPNKGIQFVAKYSKAIYGLDEISRQYDKTTHVLKRAQLHRAQSAKEDELCILKDLRMVRPLCKRPGRQLDNFPNLKSSELEKLNQEKFHKWITYHKKRYDVEIGQ
jgi:hypothetical protein